jgi:hypothetical protein
MTPPAKKQIKDFEETLTINNLSLHLIQFWDSLNNKYITKTLKHSTLINSISGVNILFNDFLVLITNAQLIPQTVYRITDYKSFNYLNGYNNFIDGIPSTTNFDTTAIYESLEEVILVTAITNNKIAPFTYSETYPNDIIYYDPTITGINTKGRIFRRIDTKFNIDVCCDWRNIKYRRFNASTLSGITGYITIGNMNSAYIDTINLNDFNDFNIFNNSPAATNCFNIVIKTVHDNNFISFDNNIIVSGNNVNISCSTFFNNYIEQATNLKMMDEDVKNNIFNNIYLCNFESNCISNDIFFIRGCNIKNIFRDNIIRDNFASNNINTPFTNNIIGKTFTNNQINGEFTYNNIQNDFKLNIINNTFNNNIVLTNFQVNIFNTIVDLIDFSAATHVYNDYTCTTLIGSNGTNYLQYFDGTTTQTTGLNL